jgi:hypothetical protein
LQHDDVTQCVSEQQTPAIVRPLHAQQLCTCVVGWQSLVAYAGVVADPLPLPAAAGVLLLLLLRKLWHRLQVLLLLLLVRPPGELFVGLGVGVCVMVLCCTCCCLLCRPKRGHEGQETAEADTPFACCCQQVVGPTTPDQMLDRLIAVCLHIVYEQHCGVVPCLCAAALLLLLLVCGPGTQVVQPVGLMLLDWDWGRIQLMEATGGLCWQQQQGEPRVNPQHDNTCVTGSHLNAWLPFDERFGLVSSKQHAHSMHRQGVAIAGRVCRAHNVCHARQQHWKR